MGTGEQTPQVAPGRGGRELARVLILGDSISIGYTPTVAELLAGRVEVHHNPGNAAYTSFGLRHLKDWLAGRPWDVIHFNWGIWDLHCLARDADPLEPSGDQLDRQGVRRTTAAQYGKNLREIVTLLRPAGRKLIWASTIPLPESGTLYVRAGEEIEYNRIAQRIMQENDIEVNDLHAHLLPEIGRWQKPDDVHLTKEGYRHAGERVTQVIEARLGRYPPPAEPRTHSRARAPHTHLRSSRHEPTRGAGRRYSPSSP